VISRTDDSCDFTTRKVTFSDSSSGGRRGGHKFTDCPHLNVECSTHLRGHLFFELYSSQPILELDFRPLAFDCGENFEVGHVTVRFPSRFVASDVKSDPSRSDGTLFASYVSRSCPGRRASADYIIDSPACFQ
jgi:hypothetical protein